MRNMGIETKDWSDTRERLSRHMFMFDIIREYNQFVSQATLQWLTSSSEKGPDQVRTFEEAMDDYKDATLYSIYTGEAKKKNRTNEEDIMERVANLSEDINEL